MGMGMGMGMGIGIGTINGTNELNRTNQLYLSSEWKYADPSSFPISSTDSSLVPSSSPYFFHWGVAFLCIDYVSYLLPFLHEFSSSHILRFEFFICFLLNPIMRYSFTAIIHFHGRWRNQRSKWKTIQTWDQMRMERLKLCFFSLTQALFQALPTFFLITIHSIFYPSSISSIHSITWMIHLLFLSTFTWIFIPDTDFFLSFKSTSCWLLFLIGNVTTICWFLTLDPSPERFFAPITNLFSNHELSLTSFFSSNFSISLYQYHSFIAAYLILPFVLFFGLAWLCDLYHDEVRQPRWRWIKNRYIFYSIVFFFRLIVLVLIFYYLICFFVVFFDFCLYLLVAYEIGTYIEKRASIENKEIKKKLKNLLTKQIIKWQKKPSPSSSLSSSDIDFFYSFDHNFFYSSSISSPHLFFSPSLTLEQDYLFRLNRINEYLVRKEYCVKKKKKEKAEQLIETIERTKKLVEEERKRKMDEFWSQREEKERQMKTLDEIEPTPNNQKPSCFVFTPLTKWNEKETSNQKVQQEEQENLFRFYHSSHLSILSSLLPLSVFRSFNGFTFSCFCSSLPSIFSSYLPVYYPQFPISQKLYSCAVTYWNFVLTPFIGFGLPLFVLAWPIQVWLDEKNMKWIFAKDPNQWTLPNALTSVHCSLLLILFITLLLSLSQLFNFYSCHLLGFNSGSYKNINVQEIENQLFREYFCLIAKQELMKLGMETNKKIEERNKIEDGEGRKKEEERKAVVTSWTLNEMELGEFKKLLQIPDRGHLQSVSSIPFFPPPSSPYFSSSSSASSVCSLPLLPSVVIDLILDYLPSISDCVPHRAPTSQFEYDRLWVDAVEREFF